MNKIHLFLYLLLIVLVSSSVSAINAACSTRASDYLFFDDFSANLRGNWTNMSVSIFSSIIENGELNISGAASGQGNEGLWINLTEPNGELGHTTYLNDNFSIELDITFYTFGSGPLISAGYTISTTTIPGSQYVESSLDTPARLTIRTAGEGGENTIPIFATGLISGRKYHMKIEKNEIGDGNITLYNETTEEISGTGRLPAVGFEKKLTFEGVGAGRKTRGDGRRTRGAVRPGERKSPIEREIDVSKELQKGLLIFERIRRKKLL
ncbi:hypothetical protein LCGC14_1171390 [marine sediment metagenome]|uniref:Uncharacterized protein n=1 Tax=marine sediment metagenome TaxID=412755 RepID=A0A0F9MCN9_9ZZZZ